MSRYLVTRLGYSLFVLWGALTLIFVAVRLAPGDPAAMMLGPGSTQEDIESLRERLGLDEPIIVQYGGYLSDVAQMDFGDSLWLNRPVANEVASRVATTAKLAGAAVGIGLVVSFPLGIAAALKRGTALDHLISVLSLLGQSVPSFWLGIMLILLFARQLQILPSSGSSGWSHLVLPAITLAMPLIGVLTRLVRSGLLDVLYEDYVRTARSKGLHTRTVLFRHAMRNMLIPVITVIGLQIGNLLGGAVIVETVFGWPGIGRLLIDAINQRDYPLVQVAILFITFSFIIINLIVDLSYGYLDPRIRVQ